MMRIAGIEEASKYKYPSPYQAIKFIAQQTVQMAVLNAPERRRTAERSVSPAVTDEHPLLHRETV